MFNSKHLVVKVVLVLVGLVAIKTFSPAQKLLDGSLNGFLLGAGKQGETYHEKIHLHGSDLQQKVKIIHSHGSLDIEGWDGAGFDLSGEKIVRAKNRELASEYSQSIQISMEEKKGVTIFKTERPRAKRSWDVSKHTVNLLLKLPAGSEVILENQHGDVSLVNIQKGLQANMQHGNAKMSSIGGKVQVSHQHGQVQIQKVQASTLKVNKQHGNLTLNEITGDIQIDQQHGKLSLAQAFGNVRLNKQHGSGHLQLGSEQMLSSHSKSGFQLQINAQHSNLKIETSLLWAGDVTIDSNHGNVGLGLSNWSECMLDIDTSHGSIKSHYPIQISKHGHGEKAKTTTGDFNVKIKTHHGSVDLLTN